MKQLKIAVAAMIITAGAFGTYAFTNAKADNKVEEAKVYHFVSKTGNLITFAEGEPEEECALDGTTPCRWESTNEMASPLTQDAIESAPGVTITQTRE